MNIIECLLHPLADYWHGNGEMITMSKQVINVFLAAETFIHHTMHGADFKEAESLHEVIQRRSIIDVDRQPLIRDWQSRLVPKQHGDHPGCGRPSGTRSALSMKKTLVMSQQG
jgi:hypothetical protein